MSGTSIADPAAGYSGAAFSTQDLANIRRMCGYPALGDGNAVFAFPWIMRTYQALEYRLQHMIAPEMATVRMMVNELLAAETALWGARNNMDTAQAAVWTRNPNEYRDRRNAWNAQRRDLCGTLGISPGPDLGNGGLQRVV